MISNSHFDLPKYFDVPRPSRRQTISYLHYLRQCFFVIPMKHNTDKIIYVKRAFVSISFVIRHGRQVSSNGNATGDYKSGTEKYTRSMGSTDYIKIFVIIILTSCFVNLVITSIRHGVHCQM